MKRIKAKLHSCRGETLVEVLASILIATLSVALLMGGVAVSSHLESQADQLDQSFYTTLNAAESQGTQVDSGQLKVEESRVELFSIPVFVYGGEGLWSYGLDPAIPESGGGS